MSSAACACGAPLPPPTGKAGRPRRWCSDECKRTLYERQCARRAKRASAAAAVTRAKQAERLSAPEVPCKTCLSPAGRYKGGSARKRCALCTSTQCRCGARKSWGVRVCKSCFDNEQCASREPRTRECQGCGETFVLRRLENATFCTRECSFRHKARACRGCGASLRGQLNKPRHCQWCLGLSRAARARAAEIVATERRRRAEAREARRKVMAEKAARRLTAMLAGCAECGKKLTRAAKYCGRACARRAEKARRRANKRGAFVEQVGIQYLIKRDGGICQLCQKQVNLKAKVPHLKAATTDHIVPLSRGGKHERRNTQLAHFGCNAAKRDRSMGEQLLCVG